MENFATVIGATSMICASITIMFGSMMPALGESKAAVAALQGMAQQPDSANDLSRTLFISMAMIESTAIYCLVISFILLFVNPFWTVALKQLGM